MIQSSPPQSNRRLGDGTTIDRHIPTLIGADTWQEIAAGGHHSLGIRADGRLFAWGRNGNGQLGDGTTTQRLTPTLIGADSAGKFRAKVLWRGCGGRDAFYSSEGNRY